MEQELAAYRAERQARVAVDAAKKPLLATATKTDVGQSTRGESVRVASQSPSPPAPPALSRTDRLLQRSSLAVKCLLWLVLQFLFVELEFGAVFFVVSCLALIWANLRSGPKKPGELSAYSVFNPNFEAIEGTLTAEQFEREIKFGAGAVN